MSKEDIEIADKRNLLRSIPNRKSKFSGSDIGKLIRIDDDTWNIILQRHMLEDMPELSEGYSRNIPVPI